MRRQIYLAGPISGLTYDEAQGGWRAYVKDALSPTFEVLSPLRGKDYLRKEGVLSQSYPQPLSSDRGIMTRDHTDCFTSDLIFCNLLGASDRSVGTIMEIAWAFAYRKPLVMVMEDGGNVHEHPMIREAIGFRTDNLDDAIGITKLILLS